MTEYIIVGDTERSKECLIYICGKDKTHAENELTRMLTNPNDNDKRAMKGHFNLKVMETKSEENWWNIYGCD